jgi:hypothetical protein
MPGFAGKFRLAFDGGNFVLEKLSPTFSDVFDELMKQIRTGGVFHSALCVAPPGNKSNRNERNIWFDGSPGKIPPEIC